MRRPTLMAALAALALAGCTAKTPEGAACDQIGGVDQCPEGQRCGADGTCSVAAVACESPICTASTCSGPGNKTLNRCEQAGVCASLGSDVDCSEHQDCNADAGACVCKASACDGTRTSLCNAGGELVGCHVEGGTDCPYEDPPVGCGVLKECADNATSSECRCKVVPECPGVGVFCIENNARLVTCGEDETCVHARADVRCDLGKTCESGACACPPTDQPPVAGGGCTTVNDLACDGTTLLRCQAVAAGSQCNAWLQERPCGADSLTCAVSAPGVAACVCPPFVTSPKTLVVDRNAPGEPGIEPNGVDNDICRYTTLKAALDAASEGDTVQASGAAPTMEFTEGPLTVKSGVTLRTVDAIPNPTHYVIQPNGTVGGSPLVSLQAGATLSGFELRNIASTGPAVSTTCPGESDAAEVTIESIRISGLGTGATPTRFARGVDHAGFCALGLRNSTIEGAADSGVRIFSQVATAGLTITGNVVQRNKGNTLYRINAVDRKAGGVVLQGATPATFAFSGNKVLGNESDQILVYMAGPLSLASLTCGPAANVVACYPVGAGAGVGIATAATLVDATNVVWHRPAVQLLPGQDYVIQAGSALDGITLACDAYAGACPPDP